MSFYTEIILGGYANKTSAKAFKDHFSSFCGWCWGHSSGNCDKCKKQYLKIYIPLRIAEKQKELGLPQTREVEK